MYFTCLICGHVGVYVAYYYSWNWLCIHFSQFHYDCHPVCITTVMSGVQIDIDFRTLCDMNSYNQCSDALFVQWPLIASMLVQLVEKKYAVKGLCYFIM